MHTSSYRKPEEFIPESELVINDQGKVYHLNLSPEEISDTIILVGDPNRVKKVSSYFDEVLYEAEHREFFTQTGIYKGKKITALGTGIGTDNIDIVLNELDALVNINLEKRRVKEQIKSLNLIRIGTSGALQEDIPVDSFVLSSHGLGLDAVLNYYQSENNQEEKELLESFMKQTQWEKTGIHRPYLAECGKDIFKKLNSDRVYSGITATANGFYGPQGRVLRLKTKAKDLNETLRSFQNGTYRITNFEMETSALFGLSGLMGHQSATICAIIANRYKKEFSPDYNKTIDSLIQYTLNRLITS